MMNKCRCVFAVMLLVMTSATAWAADIELPDRPSPPRLVNDLAGILKSPQSLEDSLEAFARKTSNQIVVVSVPSLGDYEPWEFASKLGDKWGVGQGKEDNGVIILIKPKTSDSKGQVFIAPGKGLEGVLPDAFCNKIVKNEMIPPLRDENNNYDKAVWNALAVIMPVSKGEYNEEKYDKRDLGSDVIGGVIFLAILGFVLWSSLRGGGSSSGGSSRGTGTWGGPTIFSSSSGSSGFGGFGGGSFSGGGAGGSW